MRFKEEFEHIPLKVLFADDNALDAALLEHGFRAARIDCDIHHVHTGAAAHHWLERNATPDAVVLDMRLAADSGLDVLIALEGRPELRNVPKVVLSGLTPRHLESEIAAHGGFFLEKPFQLEGWAEIARTMNAYRQNCHADE